MDPQQLTQRIAQNLIYNAPELAVWCWALLQTLHPQQAKLTVKIRVATLLLMVLLLVIPVTYELAFQTLGRGPSSNDYIYAIHAISFFFSLIHAWCWYVVLKAALENRREARPTVPETNTYQLPDTSGR